MKTAHYWFWFRWFFLVFFFFLNGICVSAEIDLADDCLKQVFLLHSVIRMSSMNF